MKYRGLAGLLAVALAGLVGCGPKNNKVEGVVEFEDGGPVAGANVVFVPADGQGMAPAGHTNTQGVFTLKSGELEGARAGKYKVLITRSARAAAPPMEAGSADAIKLMKKSIPKKGPLAKPPASGGEDNELDPRYAAADKTPLTADVPASGRLSFKVKAKKSAAK